MDYKITPKKSRKGSGCLLAFLVLALIIAVIYGAVIFGGQKLSAGLLPFSPRKAAYETEFVQEGPMSLKLQNVSAVVRSNRSIVLKWQTEGVVQSVDCTVGDLVSKDQVLAALDPNQLNTEIVNAQIELKNAEDELKKLQNTDQKVSDALSEMVKAQKELDDAQKAYDSLDPTRASEDQIRIAYENYLKTQNDYDSARARFEQTKSFDLKDPARIKRLGDVSGYRSVRDNALGAYYQLLGLGNEQERMLRDARLRLAQSVFEDKQFLYEQAMKGPTIAQLAAANARIDAAKEKINRAKLIAPFPATVTQLETKVNDVISPESSPDAAIRLDDLSSMYVDFTLSELNVNSVRIGQTVEVRFTAIPDKIYKGTISEIAKTGVADNNSVTFSVSAKLDQPDSLIKPGMTGDISMQIAEIENAKNVPLSAVYIKDHKTYVNVKQPDDSFSAVEVKTGLISGLRVQVFNDELNSEVEIQSNVNQVLLPGSNELVLMYKGGSSE